MSQDPINLEKALEWVRSYYILSKSTVELDWDPWTGDTFVHVFTPPSDPEMVQFEEPFKTDISQKTWKLFGVVTHFSKRRTAE